MGGTPSCPKEQKRPFAPSRWDLSRDPADLGRPPTAESDSPCAQDVLSTEPSPPGEWSVCTCQPRA